MKRFRYFVYALAIIMILLLSIDIHRLDDLRSRPVSEVFEVEAYVNDLWENHLPGVLEEAVEINNLIQMLRDDPDAAFENYSKFLGISNTHYFLVKATGVIENVGEEIIIVNIGENLKTELETVYVFGNALREASGIVNIDDFVNMMDFNMVSVHLNRLIRSDVVEPFREKADEGMSISFIGAVEINRLDMQLNPLRIIPVQILLEYDE